jgi:hypothetical protein
MNKNGLSGSCKAAQPEVIVFIQDISSPNLGHTASNNAYRDLSEVSVTTGTSEDRHMTGSAPFPALVSEKARLHRLLKNSIRREAVVLTPA